MHAWEKHGMENVFPGFSDFASLDEIGPIVLSHGEGIYVIDVEGRRYLDANSGLWNNVAGFNHQGIIDALCAQAQRFPGYHAFFGRIADVTVELSTRLIALSPFESGKVYYTNSGSEANDTMVKMLWMINRAKGEPERRKIITRENAYHGVTVATASMTAKPYNAEFGLPLPGFLHADCPHFWRNGLSGENEEEFTARMARNLEDLIEREGPETIAGMFAEPVQGAGGVIPPSKGYFQAIRPILRRYGIPLIADEVICGFGRTGQMWGQRRLRDGTGRDHRLEMPDRRLLSDGRHHSRRAAFRRIDAGFGALWRIPPRLHGLGQPAWQRGGAESARRDRE